MIKTKEFNRNQKLKERFESRPAINVKPVRKQHKKIRDFYNFVRTKYSDKELLKLYIFAEINCCWCLADVPKSMEGNKIYKLSIHLNEYKRYFLLPLEDLPIMMGGDSWGDKIASWRFKLGR